MRENRTLSLPLEEYLRGVLAAEASVESEVEARKAQAVISRTFALKNLGRHASEGCDFCSTTHCQRFVPAKQMNERAVAETKGEILRDEHGQLVNAYFSAACGGMTANIETLWGASAPAYLRGVRDDYCARMPRRNWAETIPAARLLKALQSDERSDVGARLAQVVVARRDATGRAELIALEGERRRLVRGWDFKLIVGRALGWNVLKSSRFEVSRAGANLIFRGGGFGHGLGLCQEGAHVMARRGLSYQQILSFYFPGTRAGTFSRAFSEALSGAIENGPAIDPLTLARVQLPFSPNGAQFNSPGQRPGNHGIHRLSLSSEHFRASFPAVVERSEVEAVLRTLEAARADVERRVAQATIRADLPMIDVVVHRTTQDFVAATGQPWWVAAVTRGRRIELQPLHTLRRRGVLATTLRHEYTHVVVEALSRKQAPRWLGEGLAAHVAGEGGMLARFESKKKLARDELEHKLVRPASAEEMRTLYAAAYREVRALIDAEGESAVWRRVTGKREGETER